MSNKMFYLLGGEQPTKRVNYVFRDGDTLMEYMATRTKELLHIYENSRCVASFYRVKSVVRSATGDTEPTETDEAQDGADSQREVLKVGGSKWQAYKHIMGVQSEEALPADRFGFVLGVTKSLTLEKTVKYEIESQSNAHVLKKVGNSIEDYLYELRELKDIAADKDLDLSWTEGKDYRVLTTADEIAVFFRGLEETEEIVGFDTESTGLLVGRVKLDKLVGISMSYTDHAGVYFPLEHKRFANVEMGMELFLTLLKPFIDRFSDRRKPLVTHNGGYDWKVLKMYGIDLNIVYDTFIRQGIKAIGEAKHIRKLKTIAKNILNYDVVELEDMYANRSKEDIRDVRVAVFEKGLSVDEVTRYKLERAETFEDLRYDFRFVSRSFAETYGAADADFPRLIHKIQDAEWDSELDFIYRLEINLIPVLGEQEYYGVRGDGDAFAGLLTSTNLKIDVLTRDIYAMAGYEFNIGSPKQKAELLYDQLGCPVLPRFKTKNGGLKTDADTLKTLSGYRNDDGTPKYPIIPLILQHTKLSTLVKNFYGKLPKLLHKGFFLPSYMQLGTETGRISCGKPNLQQTEKTSRHHMIPDTPDHYFLICDYSQVEYRIMAGMSGEQKVVDFFSTNPEADYHILAYANMMGKAYADVTSAERKLGKILNFGTTYGLEDEALALALFGDSTPFHQQMARAKRAQYFAGVPILRDYFERIRDAAQKDGYVRTLYKRVRHIAEFNYTGHVPDYKIQSGRRKAGNMPVQGTAADIMKIAMVRVHRIIRKMGFTEEQIRLVMNIHDELVVQVHKSINMWYALSIVRKAMEMDMSAYGFPPLYIGANVGYSWFDGKVDELEAPVLLMDEKIAEVEAMIARGEELPTYENPREVWADEISQFALRQVAKEIQENNLTTIAECYKNIRVMKYARHFTVKRMVDGKEEDFSFDNNILTLLLDSENTVESVWNNFAAIQEMPLVEYNPRQATTEGHELPATDDGILSLLREHIQYDQPSEVLTVTLEHMDSAFLTLLNDMLIGVRDRWLYDTTQRHCKIRVVIGQELDYILPNMVLMGACMPLIKTMMEAHLFKQDYRQVTIAARNLKESLRLNLENAY